MGLLIRTNDALNINPPSGTEELTVNGSNWLWAVTAIFTLSFLGFFATSFKARSGERIFHYIFTIALVVGSITYYAWASDLGYQVIAVINGPNGGTGWTRQVFYAKYIFCKLVHSLQERHAPY
jgi:bacteriorhodopsin